MHTKKLCQVAAISMALVFGAGVAATSASAAPAPADDDTYAVVTEADIADPNALIVDSAADLEAARTASQAIKWYADRNGSTAYQGLCERAARLSWARKTHHLTAKEHWTSSDGAPHTTGTPPIGAFVFWDISSAGHVGIADGKGGVWATSVNKRIGHAKQSIFKSYLGWKPGNSN